MVARSTSRIDSTRKEGRRLENRSDKGPGPVTGRTYGSGPFKEE